MCVTSRHVGLSRFFWCGTWHQAASPVQSRIQGLNPIPFPHYRDLEPTRPALTFDTSREGTSPGEKHCDSVATRLPRTPPPPSRLRSCREAIRARQRSRGSGPEQRGRACTGSPGANSILASPGPCNRRTTSAVQKSGFRTAIASNWRGAARRRLSSADGQHQPRSHQAHL